MDQGTASTLANCPPQRRHLAPKGAPRTAPSLASIDFSLLHDDRLGSISSFPHHSTTRDPPRFSVDPSRGGPRSRPLQNLLTLDLFLTPPATGFTAHLPSSTSLTKLLLPDPPQRAVAALAETCQAAFVCRPLPP
ncbi:hypothetical protein GWK47_044070 [Chionoecetes opilio]|uniref:Uncharacterized protein n=1 Tax=Chionoecetes opilio TaxID=41210 RepID=A0A8J5CVL6_CHIOP|nr:hypothetical protein GWK47_044070 [Chionoecetes opilio]